MRSPVFRIFVCGVLTGCTCSYSPTSHDDESQFRFNAQAATIADNRVELHTQIVHIGPNQVLVDEAINISWIWTAQNAQGKAAGLATGRNEWQAPEHKYIVLRGYPQHDPTTVHGDTLLIEPAMILPIQLTQEISRGVLECTLMLSTLDCNGSHWVRHTWQTNRQIEFIGGKWESRSEKGKEVVEH